jgi:multiple RNA-binding domain-containing protein 1
MSRLIVKNLPLYITPTLLKEHFSQPKGPHGTITDVKVILKQDGAARRFGFVGFKTDEEALKAKEWYDKTFIDSTRVRVEVIDSAKDAPSPRPNKRRRLDTSSTKQRRTTLTESKTKSPSRNSDVSLVENKRKDASLEEFMEVMQPKSKKAVSWTDHVDPLLPSSERESAPVSQGVLKDTSEGAKHDLTDMEWMRQRMKEGVVDADSPEKVFEQSDSEEESQGASEERDPTEETILCTARLFVRNLTFTCTEEELRPLFQPFGAVSQVRGIYI